MQKHNPANGISVSLLEDGIQKATSNVTAIRKQVSEIETPNWSRPRNFRVIATLLMDFASSCFLGAHRYDRKTSPLGRSTKYGAIISYLPLDRFTAFRIKPQRRFCILELDSHGSYRGETLNVTIPSDKQEAVNRVMQNARCNRTPASAFLRIGVE